MVKVHRLAVVAVLAAGGCATLIGFPDYGSGAGGSGGAGTTASSGKTSSTGTSVGTGGTTASTGGGATGGSMAACQAGAPCYFGLDGTEGVGSCAGGTVSCQGGVATCNDVRPAIQTCVAPPTDGNCDGLLECTGDFRWAQTGFGAVTTGLSAGLDGTVAMVGTSTTAVPAGNALVATFDARGRPCWSGPTFFGGTGVVSPIGVAIAGALRTPDQRVAQVICGAGGTGLAASTVVVGEASGMVDFGVGPVQTSQGATDAFVALFDLSGKPVWGVLFGSMSADRAAAATVGPDGSIYVTGYLEGPTTMPADCSSVLADGGMGDPATFVAKLDPVKGTCGWLQLFTGNVAGTGIALGKGGTSLVVVGRYFDTVDFGGGVTLPSGTTMNNTFVVRVSTVDGTLMGTPASLDLANAGDPKVAVGTDNTVFVAGSFTGAFGPCAGTANNQGYLEHLTAALVFNVGQRHCYSVSMADVTTYGLAVDAADNVLLGLDSNGPVTYAGFTTPIPAATFVVAKLATPYDNYLWALPVGAVNTAYGGGLGVDGMGDVVVTGNANTTIDLGGATVGGSGVAFVFGLAP